MARFSFAELPAHYLPAPATPGAIRGRGDRAGLVQDPVPLALKPTHRLLSRSCLGCAKSGRERRRAVPQPSALARDDDATREIAETRPARQNPAILSSPLQPSLYGSFMCSLTSLPRRTSAASTGHKPPPRCLEYRLPTEI